jgi:transcriptional regulator with XRE-family HTH domain
MLFEIKKSYTFVGMKIKGAKIRELRQAKKISLKNLALELEVSTSTLEHIEYGRYDGRKAGVSLETACKLADYFGVKIEELL